MADKVLILGGSYFVGRKMVEYLAAHGYAVTVLNRGTKPLSVKGVQQICCDRNEGEGMKAALAGKGPEILELDYAELGRNVRDFYPFFDYDNVLEVSKVNGIICRETEFTEGLRKAFAWFTGNRDEIVFKENVDKNLYEIIAELSV